MFTPSQSDVRVFFCDAWRKRLAYSPLSPLETLAADWIAEHPEYHDDFSDNEISVTRDYGADGARTNPFLHLSMHLSISEQVSIDQPRGIRQAVQKLAERLGNLHDAHHEVMEALGQMLWQSQRSGQAPDGNAYVAAVQSKALR
jgi:Domain of unknown function (DUF1841)